MRTFTLISKRKVSAPTLAIERLNGSGIIEELFEVNNDSREVKWFGNIMHQEEIIR
jgi:hypothetical protein